MRKVAYLDLRNGKWGTTGHDDMKQVLKREPASLKDIESTFCDRMTVAVQLITPGFSAFLLGEHTL